MTTSDSETPAPRHGGDLAFARSVYGVPAGGWLDLSTGINPNPYPAPAIEPEDLTRLPDRDALAGLLAAARSAYGIPLSVPLIATPGSEIAIRLLPCVVPAGRVAIVGPTYGSHRTAWRIAGRPHVEIPSLDALPADAAIVVLANPNNPDGHSTPVDRLATLAERLSEKGGALVVDEAFAEVGPTHGLAPRLDRSSALVFRSLGKFYGLAGVRLGFAAGPAAIVDRLADLLGDWPVSGPALRIGRAALSDRPWQISMRAALAKSAGDLRAILDRHGLAVVGGTDLFVLVGDARAAAIHRALAEHGIWTRTFDFDPTWLRLGLPPDASALARLDAALSAAVRRPPTRG